MAEKIDQTSTDKFKKISYLIHKINTGIDFYKQIYFRYVTIQENIIKSLQENIRNQVINIDDLNSIKSKISYKINSIENIIKEIQVNIELNILEKIPEKKLEELLIKLESSYLIFENNKKYLKDILSRIEKYYTENDNHDIIQKNHKKNIDESIINSINQNLITILDSYGHINGDLATIENLFRDFYNKLDQTITINKEIKLREDLINRNLIETIEFNKEKVIKSFNYDITNLLNKSKNNIDSIQLDINKINDNSKILKDDINKSLNDLLLLNNRIQTIEREFSMIIQKKKNEIEKIIESNKTKLNDEIKLVKDSLLQDEQKIKNNHNDFIKLLEKSSIHILTENYKAKAEDEKIEYITYRKYTSWSIIAAIVSTLLIFIVAFAELHFSLAKDQTNYILLISRLSISIMFFVLALYLSKQASKHYECYQENHRTFLQLAALEPFMARMTCEEQKEIRKSLIPSYFNQGKDGKFAEKSDEVAIPSSFSDKLDKLIDTVKEFKISREDKKS